MVSALSTVEAAVERLAAVEAAFRAVPVVEMVAEGNGSVIYCLEGVLSIFEIWIVRTTPSHFDMAYLVPFLSMD